MLVTLCSISTGSDLSLSSTTVLRCNYYYMHKMQLLEHYIPEVLACSQGGITNTAEGNDLPIGLE